jgi:hypothetical protein
MPRSTFIRRELILCATVLALAAGAGTVCGSETATGTIQLASTAQADGQTQYTYDLTLSNTSTDGSTVGTFWFAWIPGQSYLASNPIRVTAPSGWEDGPDSQSVGGILGEKGASIEWQATGSASYLQAGHMLQGFTFTTLDSPSSVFGDSIYFPGTPVLTSQVYHAGPFSDTATYPNGYKFLVQVTPEANALPLLAAASIGALMITRRSHTGKLSRERTR